MQLSIHYVSPYLSFLLCLFPPPAISFQGPPGHGGLPGANGNDGAKGARGDEGAQGEPGVPGVNVSDQHLQQRIFSNLALPVYS